MPRGNRRNTAPLTIAVFFARYVGFDYDASQHATLEFNRLAENRNWGENTKSRHYRQLQEAFVTEFNQQFGTDEGKLALWQALCEELRINPVPPTITQCRKALARVHVNLVDLVEARRRGRSGDVKIYRNVNHLRAYTHETGNFFPKKSAKAGGVLKALLREMF